MIELDLIIVCLRVYNIPYIPHFTLCKRTVMDEKKIFLPLRCLITTHIHSCAGTYTHIFLCLVKYIPAAV